MDHTQLRILAGKGENQPGFPFYAVVKYSRQAIPVKYGFASRELAQEFCRLKESCNPFVRWTDIELPSPDES